MPASPWGGNVKGRATPFRSGLGVAATAAATGATAGDVLLLAVSGVRPWEFLPQPGSVRWLIAGHLLGVLLIPLYGLGYRHVSKGLGPPASGWVFVLGSYMGALGGAIHGVTAVAVHASAAAGTPPSPLGPLLEYAAYLVPLWLAVLGLGVAVSVLLAHAVLGRPSAFPRWFAFANPAALAVAVCAVALVWPPGTGLLVAIAPNLAHVAFFALATAVLRGGPPAHETAA